MDVPEYGEPADDEVEPKLVDMLGVVVA
jgi:hypothetical protein